MQSMGVAVTISGEVNPQQLGEYKLTYTAVDNAGNTTKTPFPA